MAFMSEKPNIKPNSKPNFKNSDIYKTFWQGLRPQKGLFLTALVGYLISAVAGVFVPLYYKDFFDVLQNSVHKSADSETLTKIILIIAAIHILQLIVFRSATLTMNYVESRTMAKLRQDAFNYVIHHSHGFFADNFTGSIIQKVGRFVRSFERMLDTVVYEMLPLTIAVIGAIIVTYTIAPIFSVIIGAWVIFFFSFNLLYSKFMVKYNLASAAADTKTGATLADSIGNHATITSFVGQDFEKKYFKEVTEDQAKLGLKTWNMQQVSTIFQNFLLLFVEFVVFYYAIQYWKNDALTIGSFVLIQAYVINIGNRIWGLNRIMRTFYESISDSREMVEIMQAPHEISDAQNAQSLQVEKGQIDFKNVSFAYGTANASVLNDVSISIAPGEKVALIGPSGAGKTTMIRLIMRLHNATSGMILIDDQDIQTVTQKSLREQVSLVPQEPVLFHRSLKENIRYGRQTATDAEVFEAARLAHCDEFIDILPHKYETLVGERGVKLSGGERQRVAIARAILKNAPILILDEATSSLDSHSENLIQEALEVLMKNKTTIVIAHRLSTIRKMDRVIVMENGSVREEGTHASLIAQDGSLYKKLWDLQVSGFIS